MMRHFEKWVWTELVAFENTDPDCGARRYLDSLGFIPGGISIFLWHADFVFGYQGLRQEVILPPTVASREAHEGNEERNRQVWSNFQLRTLVQALGERECEVYFSVFTTYCNNRFGKEFLSDYPEVVGEPWPGIFNMNPFGRLNDGRLAEDLFIEQTIRICRDYGFAGWHGADRFNCGSLLNSRLCSDNMVAQFMEATAIRTLPGFVTEKCGEDMEKLRKRAEYLSTVCRREWRDFFLNRYHSFWRKITSALHSNGKKAIINSAYTKGSFETYEFFGLDYRAIMEIGVDGMVCETVATSLANQCVQFYEHSGRGFYNHFHYDFIAMLLEIRAFAPDLKLFFLHGIKDIVEYWDNLRHAPASYERELFSLANCYCRRVDGTLVSATEGLMACLADGISPSEWQFIRKRWETSIRTEVLDAGMLTLLWDDAFVYRGGDDYAADRMLSCHAQLYELLKRGVPIQVCARMENDGLESAAYIPSAHLVDPGKIAAAARRKAPLVLSGRQTALDVFFPEGEAFCDGRFACVILNGPKKNIRHEFRQGGVLPDDIVGRTFFDTSNIKTFAGIEVTEEFWQCAVSQISAAVSEYRKAAGVLCAECPDSRGQCTLTSRLPDENTIEAALENLNPWYIRRTLKFSRPIESVEIISTYPLRPLKTTADTVFLPLPPNGMTAVRVKCKPQNERNLNRINREP